MKLRDLFSDEIQVDRQAGAIEVGLEEDSEGRRWSNHEVAYWITGPWQFYQLGDRTRIAVSPLAHAPHTAFNDKTNVQFSSNLLYIDCGAAIAKRRRAGTHTARTISSRWPRPATPPRTSPNRARWHCAARR